MAPQRDPSTFRGGVVKDLSAGAVAAAGVTVALYFAQLTPPNEVVLAMQVLGTVLLGLLRRAGEELLARRGGGGSGTAALGSIVVLVAILSACTGAQTAAQRWYVAKEHYITASTAVNVACSQPASPLEACQAADAIMDRAEAEILALEAAALAAAPSRFEIAIALLEQVETELSKLLPEAL